MGPQPLPFRQLTPPRLGAAIQVAVADQVMRARAAELGRKLGAEQGVQRAVEIIQTLA